MERTFKHKKTGETATYKDGVFKQGRFTVEIGAEPSSEYWEEILSKDYEILSFISTEGSIAQLAYFTCERDFIGNHVWRIYSVKRLSDGEVFTINEDGVTKITLEEEGIYIWNSSCNGQHNVSLKNAKKIENKVLFKTLDGQEMKFGDKFYVVDTKYFKIFEAEAGITFKTEKWIKNSYADRKLAEEWILNNKPVLSLNDLLSVWGAMENKDFYAISPLFKNFKEIAENKIKNQ
jgi:hypothetical protein